MPTSLLSADSQFPDLEKTQSNKEKFEILSDYLYMLLEQLRYTLSNLGINNFNASEFLKMGETITGPIYIQLADDDERLTLLQVTAKGLSTRVSDAEGNISSLTQVADSLTSRIGNAEGSISTVQHTINGLTVTDATGTSLINGSMVMTDNLYVKAANVSGRLTIGQLPSSVATTDDIPTALSDLIDDSDFLDRSGVVSVINGTVTADFVDALGISAKYLLGRYVYLLDSAGDRGGRFSITDASTADCSLELDSYGALRLLADEGDVFIQCGGNEYVQITDGGDVIVGMADLVPNNNSTWSLGNSSKKWNDVYAANGTIVTSDLTKKNSVIYGLDAYDALFDGLKPISYLLNDGESGRRHMGLGAQDVEQLLAECGISDMDFAAFIKSPKRDETGRVIEGEYDYALRYGEFISLLIEQVQKLKTRVARLEGAA